MIFFRNLYQLLYILVRSVKFSVHCAVQLESQITLNQLIHSVIAIVDFERHTQSSRIFHFGNGTLGTDIPNGSTENSEMMFFGCLT